MAGRQARLNPRELWQLKWLLGGGLALIALWTVVSIEANVGWVLMLTCAAVLTVLMNPRLPDKIPDTAWKGVTPFLILLIVGDFLLSNPDVIAPLLRMIILLALLRCLQYRNKREDLQLILLCLFMIITSGVLTLSLTFLFQILLFVPFAMGLLFIINMIECRDSGGKIPENLWSSFTWRHFLRRIWEALDFRMILFSGLMFSGVVLVSSLIFVVIPRFRLDQTIPFLSLNSNKSRSGFSDSIKFGEVVDIIEDNSVALRVDVGNTEELPSTPYWRMVVLDEYYRDRNGNGSFRTSRYAKSGNRWFGDSVITMGRWRNEGSQDYEDTFWTFYLEGGISRHLPSLGMFSKIRFQNRMDMELNYRVRMVSTKNISSSVLFYQLVNMRPMGSLPATAKDQLLLNTKPFAADLGSKAQTRRLKYPYTTLAIPAGERNEKVLSSIVSEITKGEAVSAREFCARASDYLATHHTYSLNTRIPKGNEDLLVRWLDSDISGHCELFAGALTLLARTAGHPARIVTGFKGGTWNGFENYFMIRNRNAHAWCEVFDGENKWFRADPTPGTLAVASERGEQLIAGKLISDKTWRAYLDSLRILWYRRIVNFDQDTQQELTSHLKSFGNDFATAFKMEIKTHLIAWRNWITQPWNSGKWLQVALGLASATGIFLIYRWISAWLPHLNQRKTVSGIPLPRDPIRRKAGKLVAKFRSAFAEPGQGETPGMGEWEKVYRDLLTLRFGDGINSPRPKPVFRQAKRLLKQKI